MNELIKVTQDEQGSQVVSARELYGFLEVKQQFKDWIKNRIIKYGFLEGRDYIEVETVTETLVGDSEEVFHKTMKNPTGGRPSTDYVLTLGMAKELSMVERNAKGKEARLYFIEREELARKLLEQQPAPPLLSTTEQVLLQLMAQSNQLLANQQAQIETLRQDVAAIIATGHKPAPRASTKRPASGGPHTKATASRPASLRQMIHRRVNEYCGIHGATQGETYAYLYKRLQQCFGIVIYETHRIGKESYLDAIERLGHLDKLYSLVMAELTYSEE
jgi:phage anti-repressor protein